MSAQTKTCAQKAGKFLGIALFAFLMFFNIKLAIGDNSMGDIDLFGLKASISNTSTFASGYAGHYVIGACSDNCIGSPYGWYCFKCRSSLSHECSPSNAYCANN